MNVVLSLNVSQIAKDEHESLEHKMLVIANG